MMNVLNYTNEDFDFYPTPKELAKKMLSGIEWGMIQNVLEPSAGKGDLVEAIFEGMKEDIAERCGRYNVSSQMNKHSIDCIEIDTNLRAILRDRINKIQNSEDRYEVFDCVRLVYDDFLKFKPFKHYDLIVMNPPFSDGARHLMKAIDMMESEGGSIICLLNAETIRNPFNEQRKALLEKLDEYSAQIQFISNAFSGAERKTDVEIAMVKVFIPEKARQSDIYEHMKAAEERDNAYINMDPEARDLDVMDYIKSAVAHFNVEANCGIELIRNFYALKPYIPVSFDEKATAPLLSLKVCGKDTPHYCGETINSYMKQLRLKYWSALLKNPKFIGKLTSKARDNYMKEVDKLQHYDFNEFNINIVATDIMASVKSSIEDEIIAMFDKLTADHAWYGESSQNRHYFDGWATNKAWKIGKKVILPCYGIFSEWDGRPRVYEAMDLLTDIEKCLNYFDGNMTAEVDLGDRIRENFDVLKNTRNIQCKLFSVTFYKKGTCHITFTNPELIERFNIYAAQNRGWLPPSYGKKHYADMDEESRKIVDSFQGSEKYEQVLKNSGYYLASPTGGHGFNLLEAAV